MKSSAWEWTVVLSFENSLCILGNFLHTTGTRQIPAGITSFANAFAGLAIKTKVTGQSDAIRSGYARPSDLIYLHVLFIVCASTFLSVPIPLSAWYISLSSATANCEGRAHAYTQVAARRVIQQTSAVCADTTHLVSSLVYYHLSFSFGACTALLLVSQCSFVLAEASECQICGLISCG